MRHFLVLLYFIFLSLFLNLQAQLPEAPQSQYKFKYLGIDQGLSNNQIYDIGQDAKGFIWIGTDHGLNKYDGQTIKTYLHDDYDSNSISADQTSCIFLDSRNCLWIANHIGLDIYNAELDNFTRFPLETGPRPGFNTIVEDKTGKIWIGGEEGFYTYDLNTLLINHFNNKPGNQYDIPSASIFKIFIDKENQVWAAMYRKGIYRLNQEDMRHNTYVNNPEDNTTLSGNYVFDFYQDRKGNLWVATYDNGINRYIPETNSFKRYIPDTENNYSTRVRSMFEDLKGDFFIGTRAGLYKYDDVNDSFYLYANEDHNFSKLSQNSVTECFLDKWGTLWVGTYSGGINYTDLNRKEFIHFSAGKGDNQFLNGANIYALTEDSEGNLWIGGDNGLNFLDRKTYTFRYFKNDPSDPHALGYNDIKDFEWDDKGNLWIATNNGGLNYLNTETSQFKSYRYNPNDTTSIEGDKLRCLLKDKIGNLWIILNSMEDSDIDVNILPAGSEKFIRINKPCNTGIVENEKGDVIFGALHGFWIFNRKDSVFNFVRNDTCIGFSNAINFDSYNRIWIGSELGLTMYDLDTKTFNQYFTSTGYPITEVMGILEDGLHNLWVSTVSGLLKIDKLPKDSTKINFRIYDQYDGLQSKQFNRNACHKCSSGEMLFGGVNGFNTFFPEKITENQVLAEVIITNLQINNSTVPIGEIINNHIILEKSITETEEIILGPKQNRITLEFATLQNSKPNINVFRFKLVGLDDDWQYRKASVNFATYTNVPSGEYTFLISAANSDGIWNEKPEMLKITIEPFFYNTWLFRIFVGLVIVGLIFFIYYVRLRSIRNKNFILGKLVRERTFEITQKNEMLQEANIQLEEKHEEIAAQNEELEQNRNNLSELVTELEKHKNHLTELVKERTQKLELALEKSKESETLKSAFLANMSHEIRTPMNAIIGFTDIMADDDTTPEERKEYEKIIQENSTSLLKIIDEILDLSMIELNQLKIELEEFELNTLIDNLYSYYYLSNENADVEIRKKNSLFEVNLMIKSDSVRFKQILTNFMDNSRKYTKSGFIEIGAYSDDKNLLIYVKDTGRGIPLESQDKIFHQFTKIEEKGSAWTQGIGLGLAISKNIADALGGLIYVDSVPGKGSTFTFCFPLTSTSRNKSKIKEEKNSNVNDNWNGKKILIAEDFEANYYYLKKLLQKSQAEILWAKDGEEALQYVLNTDKIDLILMDIKMPVMDGYTAAKKIKENNPGQIIIAQTAYSRPEEKKMFYDENFDEYISKPINVADLRKILEKYL